MGAADLAKLNRRMPGRLYSNPTTLSGTSGTELARVREVRFRWGAVHEPVIDEAWGEQVERHRIASVPFFAFILEAWDDDALTRAFPKVDVTAGASARVEGGAATGMIPAGDKLIYVSTDATLGLAIYLRRPVICPEESMESAFHLKSLNLMALVAYPLRDSAYATTAHWQVGRLSRIVL